MEQIQKFVAGLPALGARRLVLAGIVCGAVFLTVSLGGYYLSRPSLETLYGNLEQRDVARISNALSAAGIRFDVGGGGKTVLVERGRKAQARMLLAEKGLPSGMGSGYELFDDLGSLGLTSFMQEVTKVRALEGEIARTIQLMDSVKAARVHIVMPDKASFRSEQRPPSASVVIRTAGAGDFRSAPAIRQLVAAAIPGLSIDGVTVLDTNGAVLASGEDISDSVPRKMLELERTLAEQIQRNINETLTPFLGLENFRTSVTARLNTDQRNTQETVFDPDSRVERSVRVVKENGTAKNKNVLANVSASEELPEAETDSESGEQSSQSRERREELTNYELNSKTVSTVSNGYLIERLAVAVVVDHKRLTQALGEDATPERINQQLDEIRQLVASAVAFNEERGDRIKVSAVDFIASGNELEPVAGPEVTEQLLDHTSTIVKSLTILAVTLKVLMFGLRPAIRGLSREAAVPALAGAGQAGAAGDGDAVAVQDNAGDESLIADLADDPRDLPQKRLQQLVEHDEDHAVEVMKQWSREGVAA
jgi:flagellar M-ring protein FliF